MGRNHGTYATNLGCALCHDGCIQELVQVRAQVLVRQVSVLRQHVRSKVVVLVLDVQQQQVAERLRREGRVLQQEVQLAEATRRVLVNVHQALVVQRDRVQLVLAARRHVTQRLLCRLEVLQAVSGGGTLSEMNEGVTHIGERALGATLPSACTQWLP